MECVLVTIPGPKQAEEDGGIHLIGDDLVHMFLGVAIATTALLVTIYFSKYYYMVHTTTYNSLRLRHSTKSGQEGQIDFVAPLSFLFFAWSFEGFFYKQGKILQNNRLPKLIKDTFTKQLSSNIGSSCMARPSKLSVSYKLFQYSISFGKSMNLEQYNKIFHHHLKRLWTLDTFKEVKADLNILLIYHFLRWYN